MAIYHLSVKTVGRSSGRSATGAAAYRAGCLIVDERTGQDHNYSRKGGVKSATLILPDIANIPEWALDRSEIWNAAEQSETRKNSTVAREFEIALPAELSTSERQRLALDFAREIVAKHGCFADVSIHAPGGKGDNLNHHAHILISTRRFTQSGFSEKTRELDDQKMGKKNVLLWRERFSVLQNERLQENGFSAQVDHRSLKAQGIDREPTQPLGPSAVGFERRTGEASNLRLRFREEAETRLIAVRYQGELERYSRQLDLDGAIIFLSNDISAAKAEHDRQVRLTETVRPEAAKQQAAQEIARQQLEPSFEWYAAEDARKKAEWVKETEAKLREIKSHSALLDLMLPPEIEGQANISVKRLFENVEHSMSFSTEPQDEHPAMRDMYFCLRLLKLKIPQNEILLMLQQLSDFALYDEDYAKDRLQKAVEKFENAELANSSLGL